MHIDPGTDSLSYWHATAEPMVPSDPLPSTSDVVVVGGGMLGVWTTYWLAKSGARVVLLEKSAIGWGATGRNGGFLTGGAGVGYQRLIDLLGRETARSFYAMTMTGQELPYQIVEEEGIDCDLRRTGTLSLALSPEDLRDMHAQQELMREDGFAAISLDRAGVQEHIKTPLSDEITGGGLAPTGGLLHSSRYLAGLARAATRHGATIVKAEVNSIDSHEEGATVRTSDGDIHCGAVVVALNAWTDTLIPEMQGVIVPTRGQILAYTPTESIFTTATGTDITPTGEYWQQTPGGTIIIGGCRADAPNMDSSVLEMVATPDVTAKIEQVLPRLFPALTSLDVDRRWAGLMAFTPDGLPVVDQAEQSASIWYGGGFCGHGMPFGPIVGKMLAEAVTTGHAAPDLRPMRRSRFQVV